MLIGRDAINNTGLSNAKDVMQLSPPKIRPGSDSDVGSKNKSNNSGSQQNASEASSRRSQSSDNSRTEAPLFPILRGESVGQSGDFTGHIVVVCSPEELDREWDRNDAIVVFSKSIEEHLKNNKHILEHLLRSVRVVITESGEPLGELASMAYENNTICIVNVQHATRVAESGMHVRVVAHENKGDVFFID